MNVTNVIQIYGEIKAAGYFLYIGIFNYVILATCIVMHFSFVFIKAICFSNFLLLQ